MTRKDMISKIEQMNADLVNDYNFCNSEIRHHGYDNDLYRRMMAIDRAIHAMESSVRELTALDNIEQA